MCGKSRLLLFCVIEDTGSPPRVREKLYHARECAFNTGITPACAGKASIAKKNLSFQRDHPRVCGKSIKTLITKSENAGSPPRVREKHQPVYDTCSRLGITPACAGKANRSSNIIRFRRDHPRVCGKSMSSSFQLRRLEGSPPRVREKLDFNLLLYFVMGITPACAGKAGYE